MKELMTFWSLTLARRIPVKLGPGEELVEIRGGLGAVGGETTTRPGGAAAGAAGGSRR